MTDEQKRRVDEALEWSRRYQGGEPGTWHEMGRFIEDGMRHVQMLVTVIRELSKEPFE